MQPLLHLGLEQPNKAHPAARNHEIVVSGMGAFCALGRDCASSWAALEAGRDGIVPIRRFDTSAFTVKLGAMVNNSFCEQTTESLLRLCKEFTTTAATEAMAQALVEKAHLPPTRLGLVMGTSLGDMNSQLHTLAETLAETLSIKGPCITVSTACSSSTNALGLARDLLQMGSADLVVAGGADMLSAEVFAGFHALGVLSPGKCAPFSHPMGTTLGEGAGFVVLESRQQAEKRDVPPLALLSGYGLSADAYHETSPDPSGAGMRRAIKGALLDAGIAPGDVGYLNAHGSGTPANDQAEWQGIRQAFGDHAQHLPVSSTKSYLGHAQGAAGVLEIIVTIMAMQRGVIPPTLHYQGARPHGPDDPVAQSRPRKTSFQHAVCLNSAFGGANAAVTISRPEARLETAVCCRGVRVLGIGSLDPTAIFDLNQLVPSADPRGLDPETRYLTAATAMALQDAGISLRGDLRSRSGLLVGSTRISTTKNTEFRKSIKDRGLSKCSAPAFSRIVLNAPTGSCAKFLSLKGPTSTLTTGPGSGLVAIIYAARLLSSRRDVDLMVGAGVDYLDQAAAACLLLGQEAYGQPSSGTESIRVAGWGLSGAGSESLDLAVEQALAMARISAPEIQLLFGNHRQDQDPAKVFDWAEAASSAMDCVAAVLALRQGKAQQVMITSSQGGSLHCALILSKQGAEDGS